MSLRLVCIVGLLATASTTSYGAPFGAERPPDGIGFSFASGITFSSIRSTNEDVSYGTRVAYALGGRANLVLDSGWGMGLGLELAQFGFSDGPDALLDEDATSCDGACMGSVDTALNYLHLQIGARHDFTFPIYAYLGWDMGFLLGARSRSGDGDVVDTTKSFHYNALQWGFRFAAGYRVGDLWRLELATHQPLVGWGNDYNGLGHEFADGQAWILSVVLGRR